MNSEPILLIFGVLKASTVDAFKTSKINEIDYEPIKWEHQIQQYNFDVKISRPDSGPQKYGGSTKCYIKILFNSVTSYGIQ